jgi:SAM-dependent methyltransferase
MAKIPSRLISTFAVYLREFLYMAMFKRLIDKNFRKPGGLVGRYIIRFLKKNQPEYDELNDLLKLNKDEVVLEIGYGLGQGIYDYSAKYDCTFYGIDFSRLMFKRASKLNRENIKRGRVFLFCAGFEEFDFMPESFHCIYFLNVIYFWSEINSRLTKIFTLLKPDGKVIIFMADAVCLMDGRHSEEETVFTLHRVADVVKEMELTGFASVEITEHTKEKNCYYITGYKKTTP